MEEYAASCAAIRVRGKAHITKIYERERAGVRDMMSSQRQKWRGNRGSGTFTIDGSIIMVTQGKAV